MKKLYYFIFLVCFSSDYFRYAFGFSLIDKLIPLLILLLSFVYAAVNKRSIYVFADKYVYLVVFHISFLVFLLSSDFFASSYEIFKLYIFLTFIPILSILNDVDFYNAQLCFKRVALFFLGLNLIIIVGQILIGPQIVKYIMMPTDIYEDTQKSGRWMGMFGNLPALSFTCLIVYVFNEFTGWISAYKKALRFICVLTVILSTSKSAMVILILLFLNNLFFNGEIKKNTVLKVLTLLFIIFVSFMLILDARFENKLDQLSYMLSSDILSYGVDFSYVDWRFLNYVQAIHIFMDNPFGLGLATWGDFSSTLNTHISHSYMQVDMSDSSISHLVVEQGIFVIIYFFIIIYPYLMQKNNLFSRSISGLLIVYYLSLFTTMGFSDTTWPMIFSFAYVYLIYLSKRTQ